LTFRVDARPTDFMTHISVRSFNGLQAVDLNNDLLSVTVFSETGARIYSIFYKPTQTEFLWHHPQNTPRLHEPGEMFDDVFPGGWDELFPTCDACEFQGLQVPDHGELWAVPWEWRVEKQHTGSECLYTGVTAKQFPVRFERRIYLDPLEPTFTLRYRLTNLSSNPLDLIWGIHPLFSITENHRLELPGGKMNVDLSSGENFGAHGQVYDWPYLPTPKGNRDMRIMPAADSKAFAGHYCTESRGNWFALTDTVKGVGIKLVYPQEIFRSLWLWQSYGGWRDLYHLAVEPWVGSPVRLDEAVRRGNHVTIPSQKTIEYEVSVVIYLGKN
jgi:hypothetical protein